MPGAALCALVLDLAGTVAIAPERLARLGETDWARLATMAQQHRIEPLLHARRQDCAGVPAELRARWRDAYRRAAITALVWQAELAEAVVLLEAEGLAPIALKGAWLARHAYPAAAMRPMRDIDLLVTPETVLAGFAALKRAGYVQPDAEEHSLADMVRFDKHLPPLVGPRGTRFELHHRLWEPDGRLDHASPYRDEAAVRARAVRLGGVAYPAAGDMLAHLIVHAAYSHRLDCGPLVLSDIAALLGCEVVDWPLFWARAAREGWRDGARLLLALAEAHQGPIAVVLTAEAGPPVPEAVLTAARAMLLQDLDRRKSAAVLAAALVHGPAGLWRRMRGIRGLRGGGGGLRDGVPGDEVVRDMSREGGWLGWAWDRVRRTTGDALSPRVLRQSRDLARLSRWLDR